MTFLVTRPDRTLISASPLGCQVRPYVRNQYFPCYSPEPHAHQRSFLALPVYDCNIRPTTTSPSPVESIGTALRTAATNALPVFHASSLGTSQINTLRKTVQLVVWGNQLVTVTAIIISGASAWFLTPAFTSETELQP